MISGSNIDFATIQAYLETEYCVQGGASATLRVGVPSPQLAALHKAHGVDCSAFVTACNPFSQMCDDAANTQRQSNLARELKQRNLTFIHSIGMHPTNQWPGEASFLALGVTLEAAKSLGVRFEQNAIIWSDSDAIPRLILLR